MKNQYGLSRDIPAEVKREVRQACGYGCVICGAAVIDYEHVDPAFKDAREHNPEAITLLCPQCHAKVTRKFVSKQTVQEAMRDPICKKQGFASELFDIGRTHPKLVFGGMTITQTRIPIAVRGVPLFQVQASEAATGPFRLTGNFFNSRGELSLRIIENEWQPLTTNWDVEAVGGVVIVRDNPDHISLRMRAQPPDGLIVEQLDMYCGYHHFLATPQELIVEGPGMGRMTFTRCMSDNCDVGLSFG